MGVGGSWLPKIDPRSQEGNSALRYRSQGLGPRGHHFPPTEKMRLRRSELDPRIENSSAMLKLGQRQSGGNTHHPTTTGSVSKASCCSLASPPGVSGQWQQLFPWPPKLQRPQAQTQAATERLRQLPPQHSSLRKEAQTHPL